jgi:hypothetical protein
MWRDDAVPTGDLLRRLDNRWKVAIVGDAGMHPSELLEAYGNIDPWRSSRTSGISWLQRIADHFERTVWINPDRPVYWDKTHTVRVIRQLFPMFELTVDGVTQAMKALVGARPQ